MKFTVLYEVYASTYVEVDLPKGSTREQIIEAADEKGPHASVCCQCSEDIEVSDIGGVLEVLDEHGEEVKDKKPRRMK